MTCKGWYAIEPNHPTNQPNNQHKPLRDFEIQAVYNE